MDRERDSIQECAGQQAQAARARLRSGLGRREQQNKREQHTSPQAVWSNEQLHGVQLILLRSWC